MPASLSVARGNQLFFSAHHLHLNAAMNFLGGSTISLAVLVGTLRLIRFDHEKVELDALGERVQVCLIQQFTKFGSCTSAHRFLASLDQSETESALLGRQVD